MLLAILINGNVIFAGTVLSIFAFCIFKYGILPEIKGGPVHKYKTFLHSFDKVTILKSVGEIKDGDCIVLACGHAFVSMDDTMWFYYLIKIKSANLIAQGVKLEIENLGVLNVLNSSNLMEEQNPPSLFGKQRWFTGEKERYIRTMQPINNIPTEKLAGWTKERHLTYTNLAHKVLALTISAEELLASFDKKEEILPEAIAA